MKSHQAFFIPKSDFGLGKIFKFYYKTTNLKGMACLFISNITI